MSQAEVIVAALLDGEGCDNAGCGHCHPEGRRKELADLGWRSRGWSSSATWTNPPDTYFVNDDVIDGLPEDEWQLILSRTHALGPGRLKPT